MDEQSRAHAEPRRRRPPRAVVAALLLVAASIASPSIARAAPESARRDEAREHFGRAVALFEEEAWDAALAEFLASRALYPTRAATKDAAICLRKLHRFDEALDAFEELIRAYPDLPPFDRAMAEREIAALRRLVGAIAIDDAPPGARVSIDGRDRAVLPAPPLRASAGERIVRVFARGFAPFEARVEVAGERITRLHAALQPLARIGRLHVAEQSGATTTVVLDHSVVGATPWDGAVAAGGHTLWLRGEGDVGTQPVAVRVDADGTTAVSLRAESLPARLRVEPTPLGALLAIDGVPVGRGTWEGALRAGAHRVEATAEGFLPARRDVTLEPPVSRTLAIALERDPDSPMWRDPSPPKLFAEIDLGAGPSFGLHAIADTCTAPCDPSQPLTPLAFARAGAQLRSGVTATVDVGWLGAAETLRGRAAAVQTPSGASAEVPVDDDLSLSGALLGGSFGARWFKAFPLTLRFGAGLMLGAASDTRTVAGGSPIAPATFRQDAGVTYLYFAPEAREAVRFADHFEASIGASLVVLRSITEAHWAPRESFPAAPGVVSFRDERFIGKTLLFLVPSVGVRADFDAPF